MSPKRRHSGVNENDPFTVYTPDAPHAKRRRRTQPDAEDPDYLAHVRRLREERAETEKRAREERELKEAEEQARKLRETLASVQASGFTLHGWLSELFHTKDPHISSQVTKALNNHGPELLAAMMARSPEVLTNWVTEYLADTIGKEGKKLAELLRRAEGERLSKTLKEWRLDVVLETAKEVAPTLLALLRAAGEHEKQGTKRRDRDLIFSTVICMLAQAYSERSNETQTVMSMYLLACGASQSQFAVLHHAGLSSSYSTALNHVKTLCAEQLAKLVRIARSRAFMLVWDNLNFAFRVNEQRLNSKDHFDNGTTGTLVPLHDVVFGELSLHLLKRRTTRLHALEWAPLDILPSPEQVEQLESAMLWHIEDILLDAYPHLRDRLGTHEPVPMVKPIEVHKTEQYPLPAIPVDESSIDGTLEVIQTYIEKVLKLTEDDIKRHGVIICAGDQLTNSLVDKASACRRDDKDLLDNISQYTLPQTGLFHVKLASTRMVANEHWGKANSNAPWSLWRMNTLLGRKAISVGWKAKKIPPFRPLHELISTLTLPANIVDAFRICCPRPSLSAWLDEVTSYNDLRLVARRVRDRLCSVQRVETLRALPDDERDLTLENIILFNRDALLLREFNSAIKRGDIGSVINVLYYWLHEFRGTGSMPKYSDTLFEVLISLKHMPDRLRHAYEMNWLVNLTGLPNRFKEVDLMQEHQNFWQKVIYLPQGSNRSWTWLTRVSVSIFILRDVIKQVQASYKTPYNGKSHTSPGTTEEIKKLTAYLENNAIQSYVPDREQENSTVSARDLFVEGLKYPHTASAFKNFTKVTSEASYKHSAHPSQQATNGGETAAPLDDVDDDDEEPSLDDAGTGLELGDVEMDDLLIDEEEFDSDTSIEEAIANFNAAIAALYN